VLTKEELEQGLLDFVRHRLVAEELAARIDADTPLFELRIVDSLRILELIAFIESAIGRKIPDAHVVLANFRSVEAMATRFSDNGEPPAVRARRARSARGLDRPKRIFENSTGRSTFSDAEALLAGRGEIQLNARGGLELQGAALALARHLDSVVAGWARELGAVEEVFSDWIALETLERAGFTEAFPRKLVFIEGDDEFARPPALCYHHYPHLATRVVDDPGSIVTVAGRCYRNEEDRAHPLERLREFTMREIVAVGAESLVETLRRDLIDRVSRWIVELDLDCFIEVASDPFFMRATRGRQLMQQLQPLKYELRLASAKGRTVAAASFNHHQEHFGKAFSIRRQNGDAAHSGCVAFGWERWVVAFIAQHGLDEDNWPLSVRASHAIAV
jgi:seryl-tRNA synthetase/acyl carrier protein